MVALAGSGLTTLQALAFLFILQGVMATGIFVRVNQSGCHNHNVILDCPSYNQSDNSSSLRWRFKDPSTGGWEYLATIRRGIAKTSWSGSQFDGRIILHANGSLGIKSLQAHDETHYQCRASAIGRRDTHMIELAVSCDGKTTITNSEVCIEKEVVLDCQAKHRTNPRKLKRVMWHKKDSERPWFLVARSDRKQDDHLKLHDNNGSLVLPAGRKEGVELFKCSVSKTYLGRNERHIIKVKNINCEREKQPLKNIKTTAGRRMTTESTVHMPTPTTQSAKVCGGSLTAATGGFQSPNYPKAYPANSDCKWIISLPEDYTAINITFEQMDLEYEKHCTSDYIAIYDVLGNQVGCRRCGEYNCAITTKVIGTMASVVFKSDSTDNKTGFKLSYKGVKDGGIVDP